MRNQFFTLIILILGLFNYSFVNTNSEQNPIECKSLDIGCLQIGGENSGELIIRTNEEYQRLLLRRSPHSDCGNYELPLIDFNNHILIGYIKGFKGCKEPIANHTISEVNGTIQFNVEVEELGACKRLNWVTIWCMVNKTEENPTVSFKETITTNVNYKN
ncbi:hypothetical protein KFE94_08920 [bacterium SCSIO 12643]|nr:hypothetical protein KFE94_08920 [bacterium SCSIO 12643]